MPLQKITDREEYISSTQPLGFTPSEIAEFIDEYDDICTYQSLYARTAHDSFHFVITTIAIDTQGRVILTLSEVKD